jgi:hypothetical protein
MSEKKVRSTRTSPVRHPRSKWWMLAKADNLGADVLLANCDSEQALPVFSGEGEAEMFVWLGGAFEEGWRVRETSAGELVSILYGPCAGVGRVALDPSPEMVGINAVSLVSVTRERFISWILDSPCSISLGVHHPTRRLVVPL